MSSTNGRGLECAILYARVSTDEQARTGYSLAQQIEALRDYAASEGYEILEEVQDPGQSGASLARPGMDRVRDLVVAGGVSVVLAQDRDRFAREPAYHYLLRQEFGGYGTKICALNDRGDESPEGELTDGILDQLAKFERAKTAERTRRGKLRKAREGKVVGTHAARYGFKFNSTKDAYEVNLETEEPVTERRRTVVQTDRRERHPYHMHDAILAQPEAFERAAGRNEEAADGFAREAAGSRRIFLAGIGTSHHAALIGEHLMRAYGGGVESHAVHSFDLALYGPRLSADDSVIAVSHRGSKRYTARALERAREAGCRTALVTGEGASVSVPADAVFETVPQERSAAHTVSYTSAVGVLALLAGRIGYHRTRGETLPDRLLRGEISAALQASLGTEGGAEGLARGHAGRRRIWLLGGGPSAVTAAEVALKIKETSYLQAEGMPTETMLHGPFQCVEADDLFVLVAPSGAARERTLEVAELAREVGAPCVVVGDEPAAGLAVPGVPEPFSALTCLVPLQFFAYHLALARGTNPDSFRAEDPRFARADVSGRL